MYALVVKTPLEDGGDKGGGRGRRRKGGGKGAEIKTSTKVQRGRTS
jgi:hypothetical protein